jgi:hypothetical protein
LNKCFVGEWVSEWENGARQHGFLQLSQSHKNALLTHNPRQDCKSSFVPLKFKGEKRNTLAN